VLVQHRLVELLLRIGFARCLEVDLAQRLVIRLSKYRLCERNAGSYHGSNDK
jgi:hypothetical protein